MQYLSYTCTDQDSQTKLKWILKSRLHLSETLIKSLKWREDAILVNNLHKNMDYPVQCGDFIIVGIEDKKQLSPHIKISHDPLSILYEDDALLIIDKPSGITVHSNCQKNETVTIAGMVAGYLGPVSFHPVNRLDKGVTGIMVIAKNGYIHKCLMDEMHTENFKREYIAVCHGIPTPSEGTINKPIGQDQSSILKRIITENGLPSLTEYHVLQSQNNYTLLRLIPHTGRTHQLRLHMASIGHPLVGDWLYGTEEASLIGRPALHSYSLTLLHPVTNKIISLICPLPDDMAYFFPDFNNSSNGDSLWI